MSATALLSRLDKVRRTKPGTWVACCPAHEDKHPSMAIRDEDGKVLVHCFAGCSTEEILDAVGLSFSDLMPDRVEHHSSPIRKPYTDRELLTVIATESAVAALLAADLANGKQIDTARLTLAAGRIKSAMDFAEVLK